MRFVPILIATLTLAGLNLPWVARASVPNSRFILHELAKNSGNGTYQIEQDVQFPTSGDPLVLRETWWIASENTLRLQVTGLRELKDQFKLQFVYQNGQRLAAGGKGTKRIGEDFIEKYFHYRNSEHFLNDLVAMRVLTPASLQRKNYRTSKDIEFRPESLVRLSRTGGTLDYAFGAPAPVEGDSTPGFWVEQDNFVLRKFRLPSGIEVSAEKFSQSPRGLLFPRDRTVRWGVNTIQIQTLNVTPKSNLPANFFQTSSLTTQNRMDGIENATLKATVEDFYARYR